MPDESSPADGVDQTPTPTDDAEPAHEPAPTADQGASPDELVDVATLEGELAQVDEALAHLDAGDIDAAESVVDQLVGPAMVLDLTAEDTDTDVVPPATTVR